MAAGDRGRALALFKNAAEIGVGPTLLPLDVAAIENKLSTYILELERADVIAQ